MGTIDNLTGGNPVSINELTKLAVERLTKPEEILAFYSEFRQVHERQERRPGDVDANTLTLAMLAAYTNHAGPDVRKLWIDSLPELQPFYLTLDMIQKQPK